jgi:DNA invertase Pin-like site-specific DNA recombinase
MNGSAKIQPTHRERTAVVYLRQSSPKQVRHNRESSVNQRALRDRLLGLGWGKDQVLVIDEDQGLSAKHASGREGFQRLVADVGLRKVGIILGYEVSRLSRNNADWHRLLELCSLFDTLIGDADGIYNPRDFNDRLLLGLKGTMSVAELHSLRLRLDAGRLSKAGRGELAHHLPTGLIREPDGSVHFDPDQSVGDRLRLVFARFQELGSAQKVLRHLARNHLKLPRRQTSGLYAGQVLWKDASPAALHGILKNPAYAGAFAYGRRIADPSRQLPGRPATGKIRQPQSKWLALVQGAYPAYISWEEYQQIQVKIAENRQWMAERLSRKQAIRGGAALLTGLVRCGFCGHAMQVTYKGRRFQYVCQNGQSKYARPNCQYLTGPRIDDAVVEEFFRVLRPAEIDALARVSGRQAEHQRELLHHLGQEVARLDYAAKLAERQYNCVDPENRLIAAALEKKWENALGELGQARARLAEAQAGCPQPASIPAELREAFADVGRRLPEVWPGLSAEARKQLLRTLVTGVNLRRDDAGALQIRIVWRGNLVGEVSVRVPLSSRRHSEVERAIVGRIRELAEEGLTDGAIADRLNGECYYPCRGTSFHRGIVLKLRGRHGIRLGRAKVREGNLTTSYTVREVAELLGVDVTWIYRGISEGRIAVEKDAHYGCYLFPRTRRAIASLKRLKAGKVPQISFPKEHRDG